MAGRPGTLAVQVGTVHCAPHLLRDLQALRLNRRDAAACTFSGHEGWSRNLSVASWASTWPPSHGHCRIVPPTHPGACTQAWGRGRGSEDVRVREGDGIWWAGRRSRGDRTHPHPSPSPSVALRFLGRARREGGARVRSRIIAGAPVFLAAAGPLFLSPTRSSPFRELVPLSHVLSFRCLSRREDAILRRVRAVASFAFDRGSARRVSLVPSHATRGAFPVPTWTRLVSLLPSRPCVWPTRWRSDPSFSLRQGQPTDDDRTWTGSDWNERRTGAWEASLHVHRSDPGPTRRNEWNGRMDGWTTSRQGTVGEGCGSTVFPKVHPHEWLGWVVVPFPGPRGHEKGWMALRGARDPWP